MRISERLKRLEDVSGPAECVYADVRGMSETQEATAIAQAERQAGRRGVVISIIDRPLKAGEIPLAIVQPDLWDALG